MTKIYVALSAVCERDDMQGSPLTMPLRDIEGWDSMRAVTFQLELENLYPVDLSDVLITGNSTLSDVVDILRQKGVEISEDPAKNEDPAKK